MAWYTLYPVRSGSVLASHASVAVEVAGALTVKVTGIVWGEFVAAVAVTVIAAVKGPARSPKVFTDRVTGFVPVVVVPDAGVSVSQLALSVTDQVNVPVPGFVMFNVLGAGSAAPWVAVKENVVGLRPIVGVTTGALTVKVTGAVTGVAPVAASVTAPL